MKNAIVASVALLFLSHPARAGDFALRSGDVVAGKALSEKQVLKGFGCEGGNISPQLSWSDPPAGAKSFVVTVYDPDAPTGSGWWHWVVFNIPGSAMGLEAGAGGGGPLPEGAIQARNDFGMAGYGGACPPPGPAHRYVFTVTALSVPKLDLAPDASPALVGFMAHQKSLGSAALTAVYGR